MRELTIADVKAAVRGGAVFASGGGGWVDHGLEIGGAAVGIGRPKLVSVDELPDDAIIITTTAIGAPAGTEWEMWGVDYIKAVQLLMDHYDGKVVGVMTPQNGMSSTINAGCRQLRSVWSSWMQQATFVPIRRAKWALWGWHPEPIMRRFRWLLAGAGTRALIWNSWLKAHRPRPPIFCVQPLICRVASSLRQGIRCQHPSLKSMLPLVESRLP
ncbi:hypothetical protein JCM10914_2469 [Paenibacillus sp. JCM 10914]|nr:hypothetical protein JCM10914_2469 [Paenibacillus sp. JCM 10914]